MSVIVKAQVKELTKEYNVSGDFMEALDKKTTLLIQEAIARAQANGRKTVMARDL